MKHNTYVFFLTSYKQTQKLYRICKLNRVAADVDFMYKYRFDLLKTIKLVLDKFIDRAIHDGFILFDIINVFTGL